MHVHEQVLKWEIPPKRILLAHLHILFIQKFRYESKITCLDLLY